MVLRAWKMHKESKLAPFEAIAEEQAERELTKVYGDYALTLLAKERELETRFAVYRMED